MITPFLLCDMFKIQVSGALGTTEEMVLLIGHGYIAATKLRPVQ